MKSKMNSNGIKMKSNVTKEICKNYRKMWIYRDFLREMWTRCEKQLHEITYIRIAWNLLWIPQVPKELQKKNLNIFEYA